MKKLEHTEHVQERERDKLKIIRAKGEGQGSCKMCSDSGKWSRTWMCFLYEVEGYEGFYCIDCINKLKAQKQNELKKIV